MSFAKTGRSGKAVDVTSKPNARTRSKSEQVANEIECILDKRGVAPLAAKAVIMGKEIGKGRFKQVYQGALQQQCGSTRRDVVVMQFAKKDSEVRELDILATLSGHTHSATFVPEIFGVIDGRSSVSIVQERAAWGSLKDCLACSETCSQLEAAHKLRVGMQLAGALGFLESAHIVHADLACRNVVLCRLEEDPREVVSKITDFGLGACLKEGAQGVCLRQPQATRWCSPETVAHARLSYKSDVWSFGATLWELFMDGASPWSRFAKRAEVTARLTELASTSDEAAPGGELDLPVEFPLPGNACPSAACDVIWSCLEVDEDARPHAAQLEDTFERLFAENVAVVSRLPEATTPSFGYQNAGVDDRADAFGASAATAAAFDPASPGASTVASVADAPQVSRSEALPKTLVRQLSSRLLEVQQQCGGAKFGVLSDFLGSEHALELLGEARVNAMRKELVEVVQREGSAGPEGKPEVQQTLAPIRELVLPRVQAPGPLVCYASAPPLSVWTLYSRAEDCALRRRDFATQEAAWKAFHEEDGMGTVVRQEVYSSN